jgi:hypothetical protein
MPVPKHLRRVIFQIWLVAACSAVITATSVAADDQEMLRRLFLDEAPQAWRAYEEYVNHLQGSIHYRLVMNGELADETRLEFKQNQRCKLCIFQPNMKSRTRGQLAAFNSDYVFMLERTADGKPWMLAGHQPRSKDNSSKPESLVNIFSKSYYNLVSVPQERLSELIRRSSFQLREVATVHRGGVNLVQVTFDSTHSEDEKPFRSVQGGTLLLDPSHSWYIVSGEIRTIWAEMERYAPENEVLRFDGKFPVPKRTIATAHGHKDDAGHTVTTRAFTWEYDVAAPTELPADAEFRLSAFGFPEPDYTRTRIPWYLWVAMAGIVCLGVGFLIRRRSKPATR